MSVITFDKEESVLRGQIPLHKLKENLVKLKLEEVTEIDFTGNGYCTDSVIKVIREHRKGTVLKNLKTVNLAGCKLLTDHGMKWLAEIIAGASVNAINLDCCERVTDVGLSYLNEEIKNLCRISVRDTSVRYLTSFKGKILNGTPIFPIVGTMVDHKTGNVLVVPHSSVKQSLASALSGGSVTANEGLHHYPLVKFEDEWKLNINEVNMNNPLFDVLARSNPVQVIIPFDASAVPKDVSSHVKNTITRISMTEKANIAMEKHSQQRMKMGFASADCFMDKKSVTCHTFDIETGILQ